MSTESDRMPYQVLVQVVDIGEERRIGWGANLTEELGSRLEDIRTAIAAGAAAVAEGLPGISGTQGWRLSEMEASFGVTLAAEAGIILSKASTEATFDITVTFQRVAT